MSQSEEPAQSQSSADDKEESADIKGLELLLSVLKALKAASNEERKP